MPNIFGVRFLCYERERSAWLQNALTHFRKRLESLLARGSGQLFLRYQLSLELFHVHFPIFNQDVGSALDQLIDLAVIVQKSHYEIVDGQQGSRADDSAGDAVVVADDGVLYGVGQRQEHNQVERIELREFALPGQAQADNQEYINNDRPYNFLPNRQ